MKRTLLLSLAAALASVASAKEIPAGDAVKAILGEGANQPYKAMVGIACAIRNRGTLHGVYGFNNLTAQRAPAPVRARAEHAWQASASYDVTGGCKYFGCPADANYFLHTLHFHAVTKIGAITFYKP